jgi:hypothetical protein
VRGGEVGQRGGIEVVVFVRVRVAADFIISLPLRQQAAQLGHVAAHHGSVQGFFVHDRLVLVLLWMSLKMGTEGFLGNGRCCFRTSTFNPKRDASTPAWLKSIGF